MSYDTFRMEYFSYGKTAQFTKEEIQWAINQTEYKYFGYYEFDDTQKIAVDILVHIAKEKLNESA